MAILFEKSVKEFTIKPTQKIYNKRVVYPDFNILKRVDLTYKSEASYQQINYPYLENMSTLKQLLPVPGFLLRPIERHTLPYEMTAAEKINFQGKRTVIYLHGIGGFAEENTILHRQLLEHGCNLIRISYSIDYEKEGIVYPKSAGDMLAFIKEFETKIAPLINAELNQMLSNLQVEYPALFENKEIILIAHSMGAGVLANLISDGKTVEVSKFINLDGTLLAPAIQTGLNVNELHLSQDSLFKIQWIEEEDSTDLLKLIGQDYCRRIDTFIHNSSRANTWIQIKDATHFTFTDFPNLLKPYKIFKKIAGNRDAAARIRNYVIEFIIKSDVLNIDPKDQLINNRIKDDAIKKCLKIFRKNQFL